MKLLSHFTEYQKKLYPSIMNWKNHIVGDALAYSYRDTVYEQSTYPSNLHYHDYYELVIVEEGDIHYVCEGRVYQPKYGDIILIPPGNFHMSVINGEKTHYKRYVFYLYESAFDVYGHSVLTGFLKSAKSGEMFSPVTFENKQKLIDCLEGLKELSKNGDSELDSALALSYVIQIFYLLNLDRRQTEHGVSTLPESVLKIQRYIDSNFSTISSVSEVAEHFFYSREYVSRLFREYFDTTISDYIMKRRIEKSQSLIIEGVPMIDVSYQVGFGSLSTFIRSFKSVTNMTPSEYKKLRKMN